MRRTVSKSGSVYVIQPHYAVGAVDGSGRCYNWGGNCAVMWQIRFQLCCEPSIPAHGRTVRVTGTWGGYTPPASKLLDSPLHCEQPALVASDVSTGKGAQFSLNVSTTS